MDESGPSRRRPRMRLAAEREKMGTTLPDNVRYAGSEEPSPSPPLVNSRPLGPQPRGPGTCPFCSVNVRRLAVHMRVCERRPRVETK